MNGIAKSLNALAGELRDTLYERDEAIEASLLALVAGEHICLLGDPGTAKSQLVRYIVGALDQASYFEVLLSKTRPAERVLGPLNIKEFRENGNYFLKRKGFATDSDIVFLDEIGKMSPVLGHDLLALLNERVYHEVNGERSVHDAPLWTAFTASNEIPTNESEDAAALWDRLLVRTVVKDIEDKRNFAALLTADVTPPATKVDFRDFKAAVTKHVPAVSLSPEVIEGMVKLRANLSDQDINASGRRWRASVKVVKALAFLNGRTTAKVGDLSALRFTLWDDHDEIEKVTRAVLSTSNPYYDELEKYGKFIQEVKVELVKRKGDTASLATYGTEAIVKLTSLRDGLDKVITRAKGDEVPGLAKVADDHRNMLARVYVECFSQDPDAAVIAAEKKLGLGGGSVTKGMS